MGEKNFCKAIIKSIQNIFFLRLWTVLLDSPILIDSPVLRHSQ